jgi:hypothetical protein
MSNWASDMQAANNLFATFIGEISSQMKGELISTELEGGKLAEIFDRYAGIDAVHVWGGGVRGVAVRIQWGTNYKTFTIRYKRTTGAATEYAKRLAAVRGNDGALYPYLTIQAYADRRDGGRLLSYAIVKTSDLYEYIAGRMRDVNGVISGIRFNRCPEGNIFLYVSFGELIEAGVNCIVCDKESDFFHIRRREAA